jgi:hypothetical protein
MSVCTVASLFINSASARLDLFYSDSGNTVLLRADGKNYVLACGGDYRNPDRVCESIRNNVSSLDYLLIPSANRADSEYAADFLKTFDVRQVMLYYRYTTPEKAYRYARACPSYREFSYGDSFTLELSGDITDRVFNVNNHTYQYIESPAATVLVFPQRGRISELPEECLDVDYLICNSKSDVLGITCRNLLSGGESTQEYTIELR